MDSDEWDDDIADEDLITALTQNSQAWGNSVHPTTLRSGPQSATVDRLPPSRVLPTASSKTHHLDNVPLDAFDSSPDQAVSTARRPAQPVSAAPAQGQRVNSSQNFRQMTLWGQELQRNEASQPQVQSKRPYRADLPPETPTHHKLVMDALKTWVYPTNLGPVRDYQFSIVKNGLFNNTLVALPTGLGKTFIAATVMLNFFRWTKDAKIIFVAPTKPLASQQVEACLNVAGIPRSQATLLTGEITPSMREGEWASRRLFFMTPQTLQNDLSKGYADPKSITLLVIDEAHRATGDYAYVKVVEFIRRFNKSFRILALTATPGSTVEGVQAVIDSLGISTIEIRTEESMDIRQYVHSREVDQVILEPSDEMSHVQDLFSTTLRPICNKLAQVNKWLARDPMTLTVMGLREAQRQWLVGAGKHANQGTKGMIMAVFTILQSLAHAIKLLNYHGIIPFYHKMLDFRSDVENQGNKGSKYKRQVVEDENFQEMMDTIGKWQKLDGFVGHPKLSYLCENLLNHFMDAGQDSSTRAIVFSEYRDSAEEIVRTLNKHRPMIKASIFVGQADSKRSEGMKQKQQIETVENFKAGQFNVLVATSIGEEGLDIGQVDLIICYDASASPIRMLQRMGRTGRKRAGNITLLLMKGREEEQFKKAKDNYEKMQRFICEGSRFNFRNDLSSRIVPRDAKPEVDMRLVEIPIENTQDTSLPEPKKKATVRKKATQKKFHMPDGVVTGFVKASEFGRAPSAGAKPKPKHQMESDILVDVPPLETVLLDRKQTEELDRIYRNLPSHRASQEDITGPDLGAQPKAQRRLRPTAKVKHGSLTKRCVKLFKKLASSQLPLERHILPYDEKHRLCFKKVPVADFAEDTDDGTNEDAVSDSGILFNKRRRSSPVNEESDNSPPKRRRPRQPPKKSSIQHTLVEPLATPCNEGDGVHGYSVNEEQARVPSKRTKPKAKSKSNAAKTRRMNDDLEDRGDDCTRTSQLYESDGSDSGADLLDFIDDGPLSSNKGLSSATLTSSPPAMRPGSAEREGHCKRLYESPPTHSQDSDGDLLSLSQLGCTKRQTTTMTEKTSVSTSGEGENLGTRPAIRRRKRPQVIQDSDSD